MGLVDFGSIFVNIAISPLLFDPVHRICMLTNENSCLSNFAPVYLLIKIGIKIQENRKIHMGNVTSMTVLCIFGVTVSPSVFLY